MNNKIHGEYNAIKPRTIKPIFIRAIEYLGQLQIDVRGSETIPDYFKSQIDQSRNSKEIGRKIQQTYKNLHERLQKRRKSRVRGDNTRLKV
jgi:hypothetical protein